MRIDCPACGYGQMKRDGKRCQRCRAYLIRRGELFGDAGEGDRVFLWNGEEWFEVLL